MEMKERNINIIKMLRLLVSIAMLFSVIIFWMISKDQPDFPIENIMAILFGLFASLLGLQYTIEEKDKTLSLFLMLFGLIIIIMTLLGNSV
jgi:heme/copper-type cytochrome/quinol oxidase subunit 4